MHDDITTEERIDNYLLGRMSDEERNAFELDLESDASLREDYECQKAIANAVQKVAMKDFLTQHAAQRQATERPAAASIPETSNNVINLAGMFSRISDKVQSFFSSGQRVVWTLASVAAMVVAVVGGINYTSTMHSFQNSGMLAYAELSVPVSRDGNELDNMIAGAYNSLGEEDFEAAILTIDKAKAYIENRLAQLTSSEEDQYERTILTEKGYDLAWYEAIIYMKQGKVFKARKALKAIAASDSPYASAADKELRNTN